MLLVLQIIHFYCLLMRWFKLGGVGCVQKSGEMRRNFKTQLGLTKHLMWCPVWDKTIYSQLITGSTIVSWTITWWQKCPEDCQFKSLTRWHENPHTRVLSDLLFRVNITVKLNLFHKDILSITDRKKATNLNPWASNKGNVSVSDRNAFLWILFHQCSSNTIAFMCYFNENTVFIEEASTLPSCINVSKSKPGSLCYLWPLSKMYRFQWFINFK